MSISFKKTETETAVTFPKTFEAGTFESATFNLIQYSDHWTYTVTFANGSVWWRKSRFSAKSYVEAAVNNYKAECQRRQEAGLRKWIFNEYRDHTGRMHTDMFDMNPATIHGNV